MTRMKKLPTKTMTLNLSEPEMILVEKLCDDLQMNKTAVMRQAIRLYQSVHVMMKDQGVFSIFDLKNPLPDKYLSMLQYKPNDPLLTKVNESKDAKP